MKILNSSRLSYRLMDKNDAQPLFDLDQDPEVMKYITNGETSTLEHVKQVLIPRMEQYRNEDKGWGLWQVNVAESDQYIGWVLVRPMDFFSGEVDFDNLELGWRFFQSSWGKGYASEAALHIKQVLQEQLGYQTFTAIADEDNLGSIGVMKNIGMSYVKTYRHVDPLFECDVVYYQVSEQ